MRHGGKVLIDQLECHGVTTVFTVPGESFLAALDGLYDSSVIRTIICRQEGGAAMMAEAHGKITGKPGICFVTRGPGAANAMSGLHVAQQDSTPMILFVGLAAGGFDDREAFQEIDIKRLFSSFVKWAGVIRQGERIAEYVAKAFQIAQSGRPGPVVIGLPEDMLTQQLNVTNAEAIAIAAPAPRPSDIADLRERLGRAQRPLMLIGGPGWSTTVKQQIEQFATRFDLPVASSFRCQDFMDNRHPCYVGHAGIGPDAELAQAIRDADLLIAFGPRLGEMTTSGYSLLEVPTPRQSLVHIHVNADELGAVYQPALAVNSSATNFAAALANMPGLDGQAPWAARRRDLRAANEKTWRPLPTPGSVQMPQIITALNEHLPDDAIITNGAGNYAAFLHRYFVYKEFRTQLAPTSGSMGYGLPAAIAAMLANPQRTTIALAGDGCFMMTCQELATAVQYKLPLIVIIANNSMFGTIRMHQERHYPSRVLGTTLRNPDFKAMAESFGAIAATVTSSEEFVPKLRSALDARAPAVIELQLDPEALTPRQTLSQIRNAD